MVRHRLSGSGSDNPGEVELEIWSLYLACMQAAPAAALTCSSAAAQAATFSSAAASFRSAYRGHAFVAWRIALASTVLCLLALHAMFVIVWFCE